MRVPTTPRSARGTVLSGRSASAAVIDTASTPRKLASTRVKASPTPETPFGKNPPWLVRLSNPWPNTMTEPRMMNSAIAATLMVENADSSKPKRPTWSALSPTTKAAAASMKIQLGVSGNQKPKYTPTAVTMAPRANISANQ